MKSLLETMRWYGPNDPVSLSDILQSGAKAVVTALHQIPNGDIWPLEAIQERKEMIEKAGLLWAVVESVPVHEDIKTRSGNYEQYIRNYERTLENLSEAGIFVVCYNFMPVLDWTRTELSFELADGGKALRFDLTALAAFDLYILKRPGAELDYSPSIVQEADKLYRSMERLDRDKLQATILAGLPGSEESYSLDDFRHAVARYKSIDNNQLADNLEYFLSQIIPVAEKNNISMAIHPDDPPFPILGLPRVISTEMDVKRVLKHPDSNSNGLTFCTGSFGVRADNDLVEMIKKFQSRIHFVHLRSTKRDVIGNFYEAAHLQGDVPMYQVMKQLMKINSTNTTLIPMRPDHGHQILDDLNKTSNPGYSAIGRLKGLAELRGLMYAIENEAQ